MCYCQVLWLRGERRVRQMKTEEFEHLIQAAGFTFRKAPLCYGVAYSVMLPLEMPFGTRYMVDWLAYQPAEFAMMSREQAERHIASCKLRLEKASRTKAGVLR